jgi:hypothetical protein
LEVYGEQTSKVCLNSLPEGERPTTSPTSEGGGLWYPDYSLGWNDGKCINKGPPPNGVTVFFFQLDCCLEVYGEQTSGACLADLPNPPTASPAGDDSPFFPIWTVWESGVCDNDPAKLTHKSIPLYDTQEECCRAWFKNQLSGACLKFDPTYGSRSPTQAPIQ